MSLENIRRLSTSDRVKSKIAGLTGLPDPTRVSLDNLVATRHLFQDEAKVLYKAVDKVVDLAEKFRIIKK